jgi:hypothetical protein
LLLENIDSTWLPVKAVARKQKINALIRKINEPSYIQLSLS